MLKVFHGDIIITIKTQSSELVMVNKNVFAKFALTKDGSRRKIRTIK